MLMGGGTMYSHGVARDPAEVGDFLAQLAKTLPLAEGTGDPKAMNALQVAVTYLATYLKGLKLETDAEKEDKANFAEEKQLQIGQWEAIIEDIQTVPAAT
jgi:hypothetical protein